MIAIPWMTILNQTSFPKPILALQVALLGSIGLDSIGLEIPLLRQLLGFVYLTFLPGYLILGILKVHRLDTVQSVLYSIGLSIAAVMIIGLFTNNVLHALYIARRPLTLMPLTVTLSVSMAILSLVYAHRTPGPHPISISFKKVLSPAPLFLFILPLLSIFGTYVMNLYKINLLLIALIVLIVLVVIFTVFIDLIPEDRYPLAVFAISISLLYHTSLITNYLTGWDIQYEHFIASFALNNSFWDHHLGYNTNGMLSIVLLAPIYSIICDIELVWVFKVIFILLFSLVPLGLYSLFEKQTGSKIAFLSCFFFVSFFAFYGEMTQLAKQQIAEVFFMLLALVLMDRTIDKFNRSFMACVFAFSMAVSHYGLSYIFMFSLFAVGLILFFFNKRSFSLLIGRLQARLPIFSGMIFAGRSNLTSYFIIFFAVFTLSWYMYAAPINNTFFTICDHIISSITDLLNPESVEGVGIIVSKQTSFIKEITKYLNLIAMGFISVGILDLILRRGRTNFSDDYIAFAYTYFGLCIMGITVPNFASSLNSSRLFQITLLVLAPLGIIGGLSILRSFFRLVRVGEPSRLMFGLLAIFYSTYLLFNVGLINEIANDEPFSIALNDSIIYPHFDDQEVLGAKWLYNVKGNTTAYADEHRFTLLTSFEGVKAKIVGDDRCFMGKSFSQLEDDSYVYCGKVNVLMDEVVVRREKLGGHYMEYVSSKSAFDDMAKVYSNGNSDIHYV